MAANRALGFQRVRCFLEIGPKAQPELTCRPIPHVLTGESPEETRKLVAHEQIEHWPKFSASEGTNSEFMNTN